MATTATQVKNLTLGSGVALATDVDSAISAAISGLGHAMEFIGTSTTDPTSVGGATIAGRDSFKAGDVCLYGYKEFVYDGSAWVLLGDEGSYAVKGSIVDADIASNAAIAQSKISGLSDTFATKVDKVEGKGLSTEDYTTAEKTKLSGIATGAQVNVLESVSVDGTALTITDKGVDIDLATPLAGKVDKVEGKGLSTNDFTDTLKTKLDGIEASADVNVIETVKVGGVALTVTDKAVDIDLSGKVDKVSGKDLSTNDFTDAYETKLENIEAGAQVNVLESVSVDGTALTITNKGVDIDLATPLSGKVDKVNGKGLSTNDLTDALKSTYDTAASNLSTLQTAIQALTFTNNDSTKISDIANAVAAIITALGGTVTTTTPTT